MNTQELIAMQDSMKELRNTLFLINGIQKDMTTERDYIATAVSQMTNCIHRLEEHLNKLERQPSALQQTIENTLNKGILSLSISLADETQRRLTELFSEQGKKALDQLATATDRATGKLDKAQERISFFSKGFWGLVLIGALLGGLVAGGVIHYMFPPIDAKTAAHIQYGEALHNNWRKLDKKDRDKLAAIFASGSAK